MKIDRLRFNQFSTAGTIFGSITQSLSESSGFVVVASFVVALGGGGGAQTLGLFPTMKDGGGGFFFFTDLKCMGGGEGRGNYLSALKKFLARKGVNNYK